jgi:hypothetical protein
MPAAPDPSGPRVGASLLAPASPRAAARWSAALVTAAVLWWWPLTDQLDLPKQAALLAGALLAWGWALVAQRPWPLSPLTLGLGLAALAGLALSPVEARARVEGWAGWLAAAALVGLSRRVAQEEAAQDELATILARLGLTLAGVAWLQAAGLPLFNAALTGFEGRRVVGTLGGPGHLGWVLALLLPWVGARLAGATGSRAWLARAGLALVAGALVLTGSRTAWVMALGGLPAWLSRRTWSVVLACLCLGGLAGLGADRVGGQARLGARAADLVSPGGTTAGRFYLGRVYLSAATELCGPGGGPEAFQRRVPAWQDAYLAVHPEEAGFCTDLRHAHLDAVELLADFGPAGLLGLLVVLGLGLVRRPPGGGARRGPAQAGLVSTALGGLGSPVLFFTPSLALAALALGLRLGPVRRPMPSWLAGFFLAALLAASGLLLPRLASEIGRSAASHARVEGRLAEARAGAEQATRLDERNPRAWIELALTCGAQADGRCVARALEALQRDLPVGACRTLRPPGRP